MAHSLSRRVVETMPSGTWNDFTDIPAALDSEDGELVCYYSYFFIEFATSVDDFLIAMCAVASLFNILVVVCSSKLFTKKGDTLHLFILNMTMGDTLLTLFCHPYELVARKFSIQIHFLNVFLNFANWVGLAVSGLSLTLLNVDKLIFFCWPFKYDIWMSCFRAKLFCYLTWFISIGFGTYYWLYSYLYYINTKPTTDEQFELQFIFFTVFKEQGQLSPFNRFFYEAFTVLFCVIPIMSSLLVSIYLYDLTRRKRKLTIDGVPAKSENKATQFAFIFATTIWTSCSLLPYRLANLARLHIITWIGLDCDSKRMMSWISWSMLYLLILNPIINPIITAVAYAPYRNMIFIKYFRMAKTRDQENGNATYFRTKSSSLEMQRLNSQRVYVIELSDKPREEISMKIISPRAPIVKFPSRCSCGSLITEDLECTRF
ncbi:hypothetical protein CAEBREN_06099 [Caenorhabditis brenneri]|uniref:G-protein coupled receptors family 1 profile domain-containing protein n=1 Tax=Caenorhabditis brenneri TaxID=135651 RepID=G0MSK1_CAEBE|nr:hypothetical protein CAEBREN_06099 [Caenorhabditis brenneri]